jgi:hypothetical protein
MSIVHTPSGTFAAARASGHGTPLEACSPLHRILVLAAVGLTLAGCATAPRKTVASLDRRDPEYRSPDCRAARRAATRYDDEKNGRLVVALAGNLVVPFAGTAAAAAMSKLKDDDREALNRRVRAACVSDPLRARRARVAER